MSRIETMSNAAGRGGGSVWLVVAEVSDRRVLIQKTPALRERRYSKLTHYRGELDLVSPTLREYMPEGQDRSSGGELRVLGPPASSGAPVSGSNLYFSISR